MAAKQALLPLLEVNKINLLNQVLERELRFILHRSFDQGKVFDYLEPLLISRAEWVYLPIEQISDQDGMHQLAKVMLRNGSASLNVLTWESSDPRDSFMHWLVGEGEAPNLKYEMKGLNFLAIPDDARFLLLSTTDDYEVIAGSAEFLEEVLGYGIAEAQRRFIQYTTDWPDQIDRDRLLTVARRYGLTQGD